MTRTRTSDAARQRERRRQQGPLKKYAHHIKNRYGISLDNYNELLQAQDGCCAICRSPNPGRGQFFFVDHDHASNEIRGLLCLLCNVGVGAFKDSPDALIKAVEYLRRPGFIFAKPSAYEMTPEHRAKISAALRAFHQKAVTESLERRSR